MIFWPDLCAGLPRQRGSDGGSQTKAALSRRNDVSRRSQAEAEVKTDIPGLIDGFSVGFCTVKIIWPL